jgi:hypothetical protein
MNRSRYNRIPRCIGSFFLLTAIAVGVGSLLACLTGGQLGAIPAAALFLGLFTVFELWPYLLGFSIWLTWFPPRSVLGWVCLLVFALAVGFAASWRFQTARPWDFYHEADGSRPGWEPVHMASVTTIISCLTALASVALSGFLTRRSQPIQP